MIEEESEQNTLWKGKSFPYKGNSMRRRSVEEKEVEERKEEEPIIGSDTLVRHPQSVY